MTFVFVCFTSFSHSKIFTLLFYISIVEKKKLVKEKRKDLNGKHVENDYALNSKHALIFSEWNWMQSGIFFI